MPNNPVAKYVRSQDQGDFSKFQLTVSPRMRASYLVRRVIGKVLNYTPGMSGLIKLLSYVSTKLQNVLRTEQQVDQYLKLLKSNKKDALGFDSGYGYDSEIWEINAAIQYHNEVNQDTSFSNDLFERILELIQQLKADDPSTKKFLDFGVSYGHLVSEITKRNPDVEAMGIDRSRLTKIFNDAGFPGIPNLKFESGDVFECLKNHEFQNGCFLHSRTMSLLPPTFIKDLYQSVHDAGFKYIVGAEHWGTSWQTGQPLKLTENANESILY